jgi:hypothetical protein
MYGAPNQDDVRCLHGPTCSLRNQSTERHSKDADAIWKRSEGDTLGDFTDSNKTHAIPRLHSFLRSEAATGRPAAKPRQAAVGPRSVPMAVDKQAAVLMPLRVAVVAVGCAWVLSDHWD